MKLIKKLICWNNKAHSYDPKKWTLNPHTKLWLQTCEVCGYKHYTGDSEYK